MVTIDARFNESPDSAHGGVPFGVLGLGASTPLLAEGLHDTPFRSPTRKLERTVRQVRALLAGDRIELTGPDGARPLRLGLPPMPDQEIHIAATGPRSSPSTTIATEHGPGLRRTLPGICAPWVRHTRNWRDNRDSASRSTQYRRRTRHRSPEGVSSLPTVIASSTSVVCTEQRPTWPRACPAGTTSSIWSPLDSPRGSPPRTSRCWFGPPPHSPDQITSGRCSSPSARASATGPTPSDSGSNAFRPVAGRRV